MQAFAYRHLVPAKELDVAVSGRFMNRMPLKILSATPVKIPAGGTRPRSHLARQAARSRTGSDWS